MSSIALQLEFLVLVQFQLVSFMVHLLKLLFQQLAVIPVSMMVIFVIMFLIHLEIL